MFVFTKKGVLSPLQSISLLAIFFTSMGVATVSPAMAKLAAQFPSNNYALISTLPTLFIVPTTLWAGAVAGKKIRYRTISLVGILLFLIGGIAPFFLTESFTVLLVCRAVFGIGVGLRASLGNALVMQYYTGKKKPICWVMVILSVISGEFFYRWWLARWQSMDGTILF